MAEKTVILRVDDIDGTSEATERRKFSIGNSHYNLDLTAENAARFDADLAEWTKAATRVQPPHKIEMENLRIRLWAYRNGLYVNTNGRIPNTIIDKYKEATGN